MARSREARTLTEAHRLAQAALGAETVAFLRQFWPTLDLANLDGSFDAWLALVAPAIRAQRARSARLAGNYYDLLRSFELPAAPQFVPVLSEIVSAEQLATSMRVTGPVFLKANVGRGMPLEAAARIADEGSASAGARLVLAGGRETLVHSVRADPLAVKWERVTSGSGCDFCEMLAGRGAVYSEQTVDFEAHDHCNCSAEPGF